MTDRHHAIDFSKLLASWIGVVVGVNWNAVAAFLSCVFTVLLILDKLGALAPIKKAAARAWARLRARTAATSRA